MTNIWVFENDEQWVNTCNQCCMNCEKNRDECKDHCFNVFITWDSVCRDCKYDD